MPIRPEVPGSLLRPLPVSLAGSGGGEAMMLDARTGFCSISPANARRASERGSLVREVVRVSSAGSLVGCGLPLPPVSP